MKTEKTALQQLIELAENHTGIVNRSFWIAQAKALLPTEQAIIEQAYTKGANADKWVSVDVELPKDFDTVMLSGEDGEYIGYYDENDKVFRLKVEQSDDPSWYNSIHDITHWMPLPSLPKPPHP